MGSEEWGKICDCGNNINKKVKGQIYEGIYSIREIWEQKLPKDVGLF